ncbi:hypothetical protein QTJ16_001263 [Diplocarpon rosae]|uniref:SRP54-type proteins GTP-binding domain-containing protein n=1 Tax=Diplocarpon rosae TaxID=946125 RepID=A0AAD9T5P4_9HELO|nr:hypothetical protein QTJ16_001263 [Diplocarpon rosae]
MSTTILDDKSPYCIPFILSLLSQHRSNHRSKPFIIGLNGVQGAGKTTLVSALAKILQEKEGLQTLVCSIDDFYLSHSDQLALAARHADNPLVQHRGEPGTHDMELARELFGALKEGRECAIPEYDKSRYNGQGDRVPRERWRVVNRPGETKIQVVIFEGWCVGFRALGEEEVKKKREGSSETLRKYKLQDLLLVNKRLEEYEVLNSEFDAFIHIDAAETSFVYAWRQEQEAVMKIERGSGMTEEQVTKFVDGYYPAYELFTGALREGLFKGNKGGESKQLRLIVARDRKVTDVVRI